MAEAPRSRGLPAIEQMREARGRGGSRFPAPKFWAWTAIILTATAILHWKRTQGQVESARQELLARQRAIAVELGPRWEPLRDAIEKWTIELAGAPAPDVVEQGIVATWGFRDDPGLYLRLPIGEAKDAEAIRKGAKGSLRDGFTSCLMRVPNQDPFAGPACTQTRQCPPGQSCNEVDHCAPPAQPYNLRVAYRALRVLSEDWTREAQEADDDLRLRMLTGSFDDTVADDIPVAVDLLTRAKYYLVVLDEPAAGEAAAPGPPADGVAEVAATPHESRIGLWRLSDGKLVVRLRRKAGGELVGGMPSVEARTLEARQRQANSCALALEMRRAIGDDSAATVAPPP